MFVLAKHLTWISYVTLPRIYSCCSRVARVHATSPCSGLWIKHVMQSFEKSESSWIGAIWLDLTFGHSVFNVLHYDRTCFPVHIGQPNHYCFIMFNASSHLSIFILLTRRQLLVFWNVKLSFPPLFVFLFYHLAVQFVSVCQKPVWDVYMQQYSG